MRYADKTRVAPEKSQEEIKRILRRYGVQDFANVERRDVAGIIFVIGRMQVKMTISLPTPDDERFAKDGRRSLRTRDKRENACEQEVRQRWRVLLLAIRAKLEAVETGITTLEHEFMPWVVMPDGRTFGDHALPEIRRVVEAGGPPALPAMIES